MSGIPFNMNYLIGDDLREVPEDAVQMQRGVSWLQDSLEKLDDKTSAKAAGLYSQIGVFARILGDLSLAEDSLNSSLSILEECGRADQVLGVKLRLAIVHQFKGSYTKADNFYANAIKVMRSSKDEKVRRYIDFALQHLGKSRYEQKFYQDALDYFLEALEARLIKGEMELIQSTEQAIARTREKIESSSG